MPATPRLDTDTTVERYKPNGQQVRAQFAHFFTFRDGQIVKFQQYTDTAQFKQAVAALSQSAAPA
jgi:ketosteroid isomerase-like protein